MQHLKHCPICRSDFVTRKRTKETCSPKCERIRQAREKEREQERKLIEQPTKSSLAKKEEQARTQKLSYGQLQSQKFIKENGI